MTIDHTHRDQLYRSAVRALGQEEADTLMASLPPADWTDLARTSDLDGRFLFTNTEMDRRFNETNTDMERQFTGFEQRMTLRFEKTEAQLATLGHEIRGDFEGVLRKQTQWVFGAVVLLAVTMILATLVGG